MRLIDADALYAMVDGLVKNKSGVYERGKDRAFNIVKCALHNKCTTPTIDAVPVTRCKDCVYNANGCCTHSENYDDTRYRPDYFCADAEPKARDEE